MKHIYIHKNKINNKVTAYTKLTVLSDKENIGQSGLYKQFSLLKRNTMDRKKYSINKYEIINK